MNSTHDYSGTAVARRRLATVQLSSADRDAAIRQMQFADRVASALVSGRSLWRQLVGARRSTQS